MYVCFDSNDMYPVPPEPAANRNDRCFSPLSFPTPLSLLSVQGITVNYLSLFELRRLLLRLCFLIGPRRDIELGYLGGWEVGSI